MRRGVLRTLTFAFVGASFGAIGIHKQRLQERGVCRSADAATTIVTCTHVIDGAGSTAAARTRAFMYRANAKFDQKNYERAIEDYDRAIEIVPDHAIFHYNKGLSLDRLKRPGDAVESYSRAIELNPSMADFYAARGYVHDDFDKNRAALDYARALSLEPTNRVARQNFLRLLPRLIHGGVVDEKKDDSDVLALGLISMGQAGLNDLNEESQSIHKWASQVIVRGRSTYLARTARESAKRSDFTTAAELFSRAIALMPNEAGLLEGRGDVYVALGEFRSAIKDFTVALQHTDRARLLFSRGKAHFLIGNYAAAADDLTKLHVGAPEYRQDSLRLLALAMAGRRIPRTLPEETDASALVLASALRGDIPPDAAELKAQIFLGPDLSRDFVIAVVHQAWGERSKAQEGFSAVAANCARRNEAMARSFQCRAASAAVSQRPKMP